MRLKHLALALLIGGVVGTAIPAIAQNSGNGGGGQTLATPTEGDQGHNNAENSGNGSNGQVGDNPNATDPGYKCYRRDNIGNDTEIVCPKDMSVK